MSAISALLIDPITVIYLVNLAVAASLVCGLGLLAARVCGHRPAPVRHGILVGTLALVLLSPGATWLAERSGLMWLEIAVSDQAESAGPSQQTSGRTVGGANFRGEQFHCPSGLGAVFRGGGRCACGRHRAAMQRRRTAARTALVQGTGRRLPTFTPARRPSNQPVAGSRHDIGLGVDCWDLRPRDSSRPGLSGSRPFLPLPGRSCRAKGESPGPASGGGGGPAQCPTDLRLALCAGAVLPGNYQAGDCRARRHPR